MFISRTKSSHHMVRVWMCLCMAILWQSNEEAKHRAVQEGYPPMLAKLTLDKQSEVRCAAAYALGCFAGCDGLRLRLEEEEEAACEEEERRDKEEPLPGDKQGGNGDAVSVENSRGAGGEGYGEDLRRKWSLKREQAREHRTVSRAERMQAHIISPKSPFNPFPLILPLHPPL